MRLTENYKNALEVTTNMDIEALRSRAKAINPVDIFVDTVERTIKRWLDNLPTEATTPTVERLLDELFLRAEPLIERGRFDLLEGAVAEFAQCLETAAWRLRGLGGTQNAHSTWISGR
jgi:hypothetical protein